MILLRRKLFSSDSSDNRSGLVVGTVGVGSAGVGSALGAKILDNVHRNGEVSGRVRLYHGTSAKAKGSILKEGLKGSHALDPNNLTNSKMAGLGRRDGRKLVYTGRRRRPAYIMAQEQKVMKGETPAVVKMSIPYDEYKGMKRVFDNPEFSRLSKEDWVDRYKSMGISETKLKNYYDNFSGNRGTSGTRIFEQDIDAKRIKGSKNYVKNSSKQVANYIKKHPGRFAKGAAKTALGTGLIAGGAYLAGKSINRSEKK